MYDHNAHTTKNTHKNYHNARITKTGVCYQIHIMVAHHSCTLPKLHLNPFWGKKEHNTCLRFLDFINVFFHLLSIFVQIKTQTQKHVSLKLLFCFYFSILERRIVTCMCIGMNFQVYLLMESFATVSAHKRTVVGVSSHVSMQIRCAIESFLTNWTHIRFHWNLIINCI